MRVSTGMIYNSGVNALQSRTSSLLKTQQQVASGRRSLSPSDDPVAAARALEVTQAKEINAGQATVRENARSTLGLADSQLQSATNLLVRVRELAVQAGNAALAASDRRSVALELRARFDELIALGNSTDGTGQYLFGGYQSSGKPFAGSVEDRVTYAGDDGVRTLKVSDSRLLPISDSGNDLFMRVQNGNGVFVTGAQQEVSVNSRAASVDALQVTDVAAWTDAVNSGNLRVNFWVTAAGSTVYDLVDATAGNSLLTGTPAATSAAAYMRSYTSGSPIAFSGLDATYANPSAAGAADFGASIVINGQPGDGDAFAVTRTAATASVIAATTTAPTTNWDASSGNLQVRFWIDGANVLGGGGGATYYDVVDMSAAPPTSIYSGAPSATGVAGTYTRPYTDPQAIDFATAAPPLEIGVTIAGMPASGDSFAVTRPAPGAIATAAIATTGQISSSVIQASPTQSRAAIDKGVVTDPVYWSHPANPGNIEIRFWTDVSASVGPAGQCYYDLVDPATGTSLVSSTASQSGGAGNTYTRPFASGAAIDFSGLNIPYGAATVTDLGASVVVSGAPANGDTFTIQASADTVQGNGYFVTAPKAAAAVNAGSGIIGTGEVRDQAKWNSPLNSRNLDVRFWSDPATPGSLYYDLIDRETERSLFTDTTSTSGGAGNTFTRAFKAGDSIVFSGLHSAYSQYGGPGDFGVTVTINGTPASGDSFTVQASATESIFDTIGRLVTTLESGGASGGLGNTQYHNELGRVLGNLSRAEDNILRVRAQIGSHLGEVDSLDSVGENLALQFEETLSRLQDLDYAKAITDLTRQQMELQAAQQSFMKISQLSLFNYM